jgi:hypothetical protein
MKDQPISPTTTKTKEDEFFEDSPMEVTIVILLLVVQLAVAGTIFYFVLE